jgi:hypothetical protein
VDWTVSVADLDFARVDWKRKEATERSDAETQTVQNSAPLEEGAGALERSGCDGDHGGGTLAAAFLLPEV